MIKNTLKKLVQGPGVRKNLFVIESKIKYIMKYEHINFLVSKH